MTNMKTAVGKERFRVKNEQEPGIGKVLVKKQNFDSFKEIERLLRYITRTRQEEEKQDLVAWGGRGVECSRGIECVIRQFMQIQRNYEWKNPRHRRHCYHEIFSFEGILILQLEPEWWDSLAFKMSQAYWEKGHQVVYAVHWSDQEFRIPHIHFAVNAVSMFDGKKWHSSFQDIAEREKRFCRIAKDFFRE